MAVFLLNNCTYSDCRRNFPTLSELIYHIEEDHLDLNPAILEEKERLRLQNVPLSYILKYSQICQREPEYVKEPPKKLLSFKVEPEYCFPDHDTLLIESEVSDDSWIDDFDNDFMNNNIRRTKDSDFHSRKDHACKVKRYLCPVPGCNKRYKNINGIKYHTKNGHEIKKSPVKPKKTHKCHCGKSYKTPQGLKAHLISHKEANMNLYKAGSSSNPHLSAQKIIQTVHPYVRSSDLFNNNFINKTDIDEDVLSYSHGTKFNQFTENEQNNNGHFGYFTPPYPYANQVLNESLPENAVLENSAAQNYQFSFGHRRY